ncbi:MAG: hypothetical protein Q8S33_06720 [Myxococcales bacterium]|nr:hypothetical protein [Myxococcales bacterium]
MRFAPFFIFLPVLATACLSPRFGECLGNAIGTSIGGAIGARLGESFAAVTGGRGNPNAPDVARVVDGGTFVSVTHEGGRLELQFTTGLRPGVLPRYDPDCSLTDLALFHDADGGLATVKLNVTTASAQPVDGGTRVQLTCTAIERRVPDGGFEPMSDRAIDVVAP